MLVLQVKGRGMASKERVEEKKAFHQRLEGWRFAERDGWWTTRPLSPSSLLSFASFPMFLFALLPLWGKVDVDVDVDGRISWSLSVPPPDRPQVPSSAAVGIRDPSGLLFEMGG